MRCHRTGSVYCWGYNLNGALGIGSTEERWAGEDPGLAPASDVVALQYGSCALMQSGTVKCWGNDLSSEKTETGRPATRPIARRRATSSV